MPSTNDISLLDSKFMALFIGKPGAGKTLAGASFSEVGPMEFADFDGRMKPIRLHYPNSDIHYTSFSMQNALDFSQKYLPDMLRRCDYKTFQLAGITSFSNAAITAQMYQKSGGKTTKSGIQVPSWDEFSGEAMLLSQSLDIMRALPCNVIVEAHPVARINMASSERYTSIVSFGPKIESVLPGFFDEIWYFDTEFDINGMLKYVVNTRPSAQSPLAKTSLPLPHKFSLTDDDGKVISLYRLIQESLAKYEKEGL